MTTPPGFLRAYPVELLCEDEPNWSPEALDAAVRKHCPGVDVRSNPATTACFHPSFPIELKDETVCPQTVVMKAARGPDLGALEPSLQQSWRFADARAVVGRARHTVVVSDLMSASLEPPMRLELLQRVLAGVLEVVPAIAVHWVASGQLTDPREVLAGLRKGEYASPQHGAINARMFRVGRYGDEVEGKTNGDVVMDTLGLAALGLADLQCHFRQLDPQRVARVLLNTGLYLFENGPVIEDGHTVAGVTAKQQWVCRFEDALVGPARPVIDLNPGEPYAAGDRA